MSQDQNAVNAPPKRFLRKGEGLKRFAAYKPPLPTTAKKVERRQTFVRFKLNRNSITREPVQMFIPPEILNDDSINLSTEIPKIAPPKIIHTPIRPNRNALGTLTNESSLFTDSEINGNIDNLFKKIEERKSALQENEEHGSFLGDDTTSFFNKESSKQNTHKHDDTTVLKSVTLNKQAKKRDECSPKRLDSPEAELRVAKPKRAVKASNKSPPAADKAILELTKHFEKIESTVNELREKLKDCACCAPPASQTTRRRPTTRAAAKAAKSKTDAKPAGPSADADKITTTKERLDNLAVEFAQLKAKLDDINCNQ